MVSVSFAIQKSLNTVATATAQKLGVQECFNFLQDTLGFTTLVERKEINGQVYSDIALSPISHGAFTEGVTVLEVTQGYTMFANDGMVSGAKFFTMIRDSNDEIIIDNTGTENQRYAVSEQTAYIMTRMLRNVVELPAGTAQYVFRDYRTFDAEVEVCGKTGSTNDDRDRYFVGYTPDFTAAVWFGYDNNKSLGGFSYNPATRLWVEVFNRIYAAYEEEGLYYQQKFSRPSSIVEVEYCTVSGKKPTEACRRDIEVMTTGTCGTRAQARSSKPACLPPTRSRLSTATAIFPRITIRLPSKSSMRRVITSSRFRCVRCRTASSWAAFIFGTGYISQQPINPAGTDNVSYGGAADRAALPL